MAEASARVFDSDLRDVTLSGRNVVSLAGEGFGFGKRTPNQSAVFRGLRGRSTASGIAGRERVLLNA